MGVEDVRWDPKGIRAFYTDFLDCPCNNCIL